MGFDIYGEQLPAGHCEVHPWVAVEYPCPVCLEETNKHEREKADHERALEAQRERDDLERLRARVEELEKQLKQKELFREAWNEEADKLRDWQRRALFWIHEVYDDGLYLPEEHDGVVKLISEAEANDGQ